MLFLATLLLGLGLLSLGCASEGQAEPAPVDRSPLDVRTVAATREDVPNEFRFIGTVEARNRVELRARVRGYVTEIGFQEGAVVDAGQVLFEIDTRPFRAEQRAAAASLRIAQTRLDEANQQLEREQRLIATGVSSQEAVDTALADVQALSAQVRQQQAALEQAELELGYSRVRAPFRGRIGERLVDKGELVGGTDATLLAVLVEEDPVHVRFSPTERERRRIVDLAPEIESTDVRGQANVDLHLSDGTVYPERGTLSFVDNTIDPNVRSLVYKAIVANPRHQLKPGESVEVTLRLPPTTQTLVPSIAVASVQDVDYVYVVEDGAAKYREIELGRAVGELRIVRSGLEPGQDVIVHGLQRVSDGAHVRIMENEGHS